VVIGLLVGLAVGLLAGGSMAAARWGAKAAQARAESARALSDSRAELVRAQVALEHERAAAADRDATGEEVRKQLAGEFAQLSRQALQQNNAQFLELADSRLKEAQQAAKGDLENRKEAIEHLLVPLRDQLGKYEKGMRDLEQNRQEAYAGLHAQVKQLNESQDRLQSETRNLVTALRSPATRGRWGEMQLRRVVEMAGMLEHCDFNEQVTADGADGRVRPDMVVHLAGDKHVVVDAKVPLQAFLDANEASDEESRKGHLVVHARQLRAHVDALSKKAYWQQFDETPEYVVAFIPGDSLLSAALEHDPALLEYALSHQVLLATPTNLIALLRTVAHGWQQDALVENAREVQHLGRDLYTRIATFGEHLARTGRSLSGAVEAYNKAVGSLEHSVLPQARRFKDLGVVGGADKELPELDQIDAVTRRPQSTELVLPPTLELVEADRDDRPELPGVAEG
jgi:DNA recombination protein RmuC